MFMFFYRSAASLVAGAGRLGWRRLGSGKMPEHEGFAPAQHKGMSLWAKVFLRVFGVRGGCVVAVGDGPLGGGVVGDRDDDY